MIENLSVEIQALSEEPHQVESRLVLMEDALAEADTGDTLSKAPYIPLALARGI